MAYIKMRIGALLIKVLDVDDRIEMSSGEA